MLEDIRIGKEVDEELGETRVAYTDPLFKRAQKELELNPGFRIEYKKRMQVLDG